MSENIDQLKGAISTTLETRGVLAKIRAELRAHVFLALDEQESAAVTQPAAASTVSPATRTHMLAKKQRIADLHRDPSGQETLELIKDFLDCFQLEYTHALLNTEADASGYKANRKLLADRYNLPVTPNQPLLFEIMRRMGADNSQSPREPYSASAADSDSQPSHSRNGSHSRSGSTEFRVPSSSQQDRSNSPPHVLSPDNPPAASNARSSRALYRENARMEEEDTAKRAAEKEREQQREQERDAQRERTREREQEEERSKKAASTAESDRVKRPALASLLSDDKLSPRAPLGSLSPSSLGGGGLGSLAPLPSLKKPSLGALAPLGGLSPTASSLSAAPGSLKPALGVLKPPASAAATASAPERRVSPPVSAAREEPSPRSAEPSPKSSAAPSSLSSAPSTAYAPSYLPSSSSAAPSSSKPSASASAASLFSAGMCDADELDLDALEAEFGTPAASKKEVFLPSSDSAAPTTSRSNHQSTASPAVKSTTPPLAASAAPSKPSSSLSSLSSLPSFKSSSSSLAPLPGLGRSSFAAAPLDDDDHDAQMERLLAAKPPAPAAAASKPAAAADPEYEDSFVDGTPQEQSIEEEEIEEEETF